MFKTPSSILHREFMLYCYADQPDDQGETRLQLGLGRTDFDKTSFLPQLLLSSGSLPYGFRGYQLNDLDKRITHLELTFRKHSLIPKIQWNVMKKV